MNAALLAVLNIVQLVLPFLDDASKINGIIQALQRLIPLIDQWIRDVAPMVKNIIAALQGNPATTPEQIEELEKMSQEVDAKFEAAATKAVEEDQKE